MRLTLKLSMGISIQQHLFTAQYMHGFCGGRTKMNQSLIPKGSQHQNRELPLSLFLGLLIFSKKFLSFNRNQGREFKYKMGCLDGNQLEQEVNLIACLGISIDRLSWSLITRGGIIAIACLSGHLWHLVVALDD